MVRNLFLGTCIAALTLAETGMAQAQVSSAGDANSQSLSIDDIVVTARRVEEKLQDIPVAVSALSGSQLSQQGIREVRDLNAAFPNLSVQQGNSGAGAAVFTIRGQSLSNILLTIDPAVGTYIDGVNVARAYGVRAGLVDIGRVEVLRGPQGTLYGKNSTGGAVSFYTADPTDRFSGRVEASYGNYETFNANAVLNVPITPELSTRFVLQHSKHDPYNFSDTTGIGLAKDDTWYGRAKVKYSGERLTATLTGDFTSLDVGGQPVQFLSATSFNGPNSTTGNNALLQIAIQSGIAPGATSWASLSQGQRTAAFDLLNAQRSDFYRNKSEYGGHKATFNGQNVSLDLNYEISDVLAVRSITGYRNFRTITSADNDATIFTISESRQPTRDRFFSEELQLIGNMDAFSWVAGLYYSHESGNLTELSRTTPNRSANLGLARLSITDVDITNKSIGAFAQVNWKITDRLTLTGGGRWTKETKGIDFHNGTYTGPGNPQLTGDIGTFSCTVGINGAFIPAGQSCLRKEEDSFEKPSWLASIDFKVTPDVLVYAKFATGFKGGGQQARASGTSDASYQEFLPETVTEFEIGLKSEFLDRKAQFNLALFRDKYEAIQKSQFIVPPLTRVQNATAATLKGVEAELVLRPVRGLTVTGNLGYLDAEYGRDSNAACASPFQLGCFYGQRWPAPKWNYSLGARYVANTSAGDLTASVNWVWQDDLILVPESPEFAINAIQPSYGLLSGRIGFNIRELDLEVAVFGRNLTDKQYFTSAIALQNLGLGSAFTGEPRTFGVQLIKRFGGF